MPVLQMFHWQTINKQKLEQRSGYGLDDSAFESPQDKRFFSSPKYPIRLWVPPSFLFNRYRGIFPARKSGRGEKFTTHLHHPEPSLRMELYVHSHCMLSCNGQGLLFLLTILELLFEPTLVSDCPISPSGKSHCSGSDQFSAALNPDRNKIFDSATHYPRVISHSKHIILLCTQWT